MFRPTEDNTAFFTFHGYLKTDTGSPIAGAEVRVYVGKEVVDAHCVTESNGEYGNFPSPNGPPLFPTGGCEAITVPTGLGVTARYNGQPGTPAVTIPATPGLAPSVSPTAVPPS
jgi:hypothetical protein